MLTVARFDGLLQSMQNPAVLLSPLTTQEAVLSSKIEGTQVTLQEVLEFEADPTEHKDKHDDIEEVLNYRKAMHYAVENLEKVSFSGRLIKGVHSILLDGVRGQNKDRGNFRSGQVHIGKSKDIADASFVPPPPQDIPGAFSNLEKYCHEQEKDDLVQLAIVHAQFEIIHPFWDGNGRVGRIILPIFLYFKGVLSRPMFYLSAYFEKNRDEYYTHLQGISTRNDWESWIEYFLRAVIEQAKDNVSKAKAIHDLYDQKKLRIVELTHSQFAIQTLDFLFSFPIFTSTQFVSHAGIPYRTAQRILLSLAEGGVVKEVRKKKGRLPAVYLFPKLIQITG
ncbi:MAG: Fic family protein [Desulfamplus sp.]|nr:Fic family protein [Desulfamplus sp.]